MTIRSDTIVSLRLLFAAALLFVGCERPIAQEPSQPVAAEILQVAGKTMGTQYEVKIADPPADLAADWQLLVDRELRRVNDQMSTYISTSEISRFNDSTSLEWFDVSPETASVVAAALQISEKSGGALDVTVGPLVNLWSFGPHDHKQELPSQEAIDTAAQSTGYQSLHVRSDPPALRKDKPLLRVDLSAIAKGHGVDRILDLLVGLGCKNVFVNIGGEIRACGDKGPGRPWRAGVERPDELTTILLFPVAIENEAIATSGDYRNFFEIDGKRYSHTIDPRNGRPVTHSLASVSVVASSCMLADGWATALNVLGPAEGPQVAVDAGLDAFMLERADGKYLPHPVGRFVDWSKPPVIEQD
ncbi:Thiamine biosynthesis lipoprotein ApbE precursor [Rosistilla ulvae]|uniref:FAD:protein FMN transferase n=1 Tax=Rosistilla ulvae TaxID=1930277 RepID=A0A517M1Q5_9BACT|nr:FAD:protein FMN transferase [Rosistilla ulvae]QDS88815.1 Thiamine biosynthesis lipoprotein ApbE precursor [Rosistilla ulvae]